MISNKTNHQKPSSGSIYIWSFVGLLALTVVLYWPSLFYDFIRSADDDWLIINNPAIKNLSLEGIYFIFFEDNLEMHYHPISYLSLAIDYHFFGLNPTAMKVHNLLLHLFCGGLILVFFRQLKINKWVALMAVGLFLIHPLQIESVTWAMCRRQVLLMFYALLSLVAFTKSLSSDKRSWQFFILALLLYCLATLSKATAFVLPFVFILIAWYQGKWKTNKKLWIQLILLIPIMLFFFKINTVANDRNFLARDFDYEWWQHIFFIGYSYTWYWIKMIVPYPLSMFYPVMSENGAMPITYIAFTIISIGIAISAVYAWFKGYKMYFFIVAFYSITMSIKLDHILLPPADIPSLVADRYIYFSSPVMFLAISLGLYYLVKNKNFLIGVYISILIGFSVLFRGQIPAWKSDFHLFENIVKHYPNEEFYERLAIVQKRDGKIENAYKSLKAAESLNTNIWIRNHWHDDFEIGQIYFNQNDFNEAQIRMESALKGGALNIDYVNFYLGLSKLLQSDSSGYKDLTIALEKVTQQQNYKEFTEIYQWKSSLLPENFHYEIPVKNFPNN